MAITIFQLKKAHQIIFVNARCLAIIIFQQNNIPPKCSLVEDDFCYYHISATSEDYC